MQFSPAANWIWAQGEAAPRNKWYRFRRAFQCPDNVVRARLLISADSRYELYTNGTWLGVGPGRAYPWNYSYDEYDLTAQLQPGAENILGMLVVHWGDHTFQYIRGRGGLLCELILELHDGTAIHIGSDDTWQVAPEEAMRAQTPRISLQQGYEEQYDARHAEPDWLTTVYNAHHWSMARIIGPVGSAPWTDLQERSIPFLSCDDVAPVRVLAAELARPRAGYRWTFDLRHYFDLARDGIRANPPEISGHAFATEIIAEHPCTITISSPGDYEANVCVLRGQRIGELPATVELHQGKNLFVITGTPWPALYFATEEQLTFDASRLTTSARATPCPWAFLGPFDTRTSIRNQLMQAIHVEELPTLPVHPLTEADNLEDIYLLTSQQHFLLPASGFCDPAIAGPQPRQALPELTAPIIEHPAHLLHQNALATTLFPQTEGDTHLVIDFGRELVGYLLFELDAPEGTIIDANLFEGTDEGGIFWMQYLRNSLRYICRQGRQTFRSHVRRGFRYLSLTVRADAPVKIYNVRCLQSTYPVEERGRFACSDALLTQIWQVAAYTVQLCMEDTYTDCPAYEQTFWVGDARNSALVNAVAFGAYELTEHCLRLSAESLSPNIDRIKPPRVLNRPGLTVSHAASGWFDEIPMWSFLWLWNVQEHYHLTGDLTILRELYPAVRECLSRVLSFLTERDLVDIPDVWNLVDWSAMDLVRYGEVTSSNALLVESLRRAASMAKILLANADTQGMVQLQAEAEQYRTMAERVYQAINRYCWSEEQGAYVDTLRDEKAYTRHQDRLDKEGVDLQTFLLASRVSEPTNTLVLLCNCAPPERVSKIFPLVQKAGEGKFIGSNPGEAPSWPAEKVVPVGSPWFLFFTLETLLAQNEVELAIRIIREQWGRMLEKGATTFWETFPAETGEHWSRSLCHGWSAAPAYFLSTLVLGVSPITPGYERVRIAPRHCGLTWANGYVPTPRGDIAVEWKQIDDAWEVQVHLPDGITGELQFDEGTSLQHLTGTQGELEQRDGATLVTLHQGGTTRYRATK